MDGSSTLGSAVANSNGDWSFSPSNGFAQGDHYITASVTLSGQTVSNYLSFAYDTVAPPAPSAPQLSLGGSAADTATPTFSGTSEDNDEVLLLDGNSIVGSGMATPQGTWTVETGPLGLGNHSISAESIDPAGNVSPLSATDAIVVVPPPPGEVTLNDAAMIEAGVVAPVGTVSPPSGTPYGGTVTEYGGPVTDNGFTLTDLSRSAYSFISWDQSWAFTHDVGGPGEYYDGADVLIVPSNFLTESPAQLGHLDPSIADTIDLKRSDGAAFSLTSIEVGPTADSPTSAVFTGTTASGQTITETFELNLPENSTLQPVALIGFNDVTDVKFTERYSNSGDATSIEFDNIVVGDPILPPSQNITSLTTPVTLDDEAMIDAGEAPLVSTDENVFSKSTYSYYGTITADGFTISNPDRSDFGFESYDSNFAATNNYSYNGPDVLIVPIGQNFTPATVEITRQDGKAFGIESIALCAQLPSNPGAISVTFTGTTAGGSTVTQVFALDNAQGFQTFDFGSDFDDLTSLQFVGAATQGLFPLFQFDNITLTPPAPPAPSGLALSSSSDSGVKGDGITDVTTPQITGSGIDGDTVTLYDGTTVVGTDEVADNTWAITTSTLTDGTHNLSAVQTDAQGNVGLTSTALPLTIDANAPAITEITAHVAGGPTPNAGFAISGDTVEIDVALSDGPLVVTGGSPILELGTLATSFISTQTDLNNGILAFDYVVAKNQKLTALKVSSLTLPKGGTVTDEAGNAANLKLTTAQEPLSISADGVVPTVESVTVSPSRGPVAEGTTIAFSLRLSEDAKVTGTPTLALSDGEVATYFSGAGTTSLVFHYAVGAETTSDLKITRIDQSAGNAITDTAGNPLSPVLSDDLKLQIGVPPTPKVAGITAQITGGPTPNAHYAVAGDTVEIDIALSDSPLEVTGGDPVLKLGSLATIYASTQTDLNNGILAFDYTVAENQKLTALKVSSLTLPKGVTIADQSGNPANLKLSPAQEALGISADGVLPTVTSAKATSTSKTIVNGDTVLITLAMNEAVTVTGTPTLSLNDGGTASYVSTGTGGKSLVFSYLVQSGETSTDLKTTALNEPNSATINDTVAGNAMSPTSIANLSLNLNLKINPPSPAKPLDAGLALFVNSIAGFAPAGGHGEAAIPPATTDRKANDLAQSHA